jgi:hypothetical protein
MRNSADLRQDEFAIGDEASRKTIYAASTLNLRRTPTWCTLWCD